MSELLSQLWTPELQAAFTAVVVVLVILYVLSIVWVARDAYQRGTSWVWCLIALIPFLGVVAYFVRISVMAFVLKLKSFATS